MHNLTDAELPRLMPDGSLEEPSLGKAEGHTKWCGPLLSAVIPAEKTRAV